MQSPRIYIAGPMRGYPLENFPAFDEAAEYMRRCQWDVVSPADLDRAEGHDPTSGEPIPVSDAIARDILALRGCDAILLLPGWEDSRGVAVELALARALDPPIAELVYDRYGTPRVRPFYGATLLTPTDDYDESWAEDEPYWALNAEPSAAPVQPPRWQGGPLEDWLDWVEDSETTVDTHDTGIVRHFSTGATRGTAVDKLDYEGFLSPQVLEYYAQYMDSNREQPDGSFRDSDNWQKGFPIESYVKSGWRHWVDVWKGHRNGRPDLKACAAMLFNVMGYMHQTLKEEGDTDG